MMRLAIVLLYTTGMRRRELTRLTVGDYEPREHTLMIRESTFHKSRLIPVSRDAAREIDGLLDRRRHQRYPTGADSPLLWHRHRGYSGGGLECAVRALFGQAAIRTSAGQLPRPDDCRHGFAVTVLLRWYRAGLDVQAKLPFLAHYMGHVSIVSTAYDLQFVEPLAAAASARFADHLPRVRGSSPHTVLSYRDSLVLFLRFVADRRTRCVSRLDLEDLGPSDVVDFLQHLERDRHTLVATRNVRLAAIHAFFRYCATEEPARVEHCQRLLAVPFKQSGSRPIEYFDDQPAGEVLRPCDRRDAHAGYQTTPPP